jgi:hypothetical protein
MHGTMNIKFIETNWARMGNFIAVRQGNLRAVTINEMTRKFTLLSTKITNILLFFRFYNKIIFTLLPKVCLHTWSLVVFSCLFQNLAVLATRIAKEKVGYASGTGVTVATATLSKTQCVLMLQVGVLFSWITVALGLQFST